MTDLRPSLRSIQLVCPACRAELAGSASALHCPRCERHYPVVDGRPDFVGGPPPSAPAGPAGGRLRRHLAALPPHPTRWLEPLPSGIVNDHAILRRFLARMPAGAVALDLGSGDRRLDPRLVTSDIEAWPNVDVVADAHRLPFADGSFDAIVLQEVIEHVLDPGQVLAEARRVTRPGGEVYVEAPFVFPEHADHDYRRWTQRGLELDVGRHFEAVESGPVIGAASALSVTWRSFLESRTGLHWALRNTLAWATSWVRHLEPGRAGETRLYAASYVIGRAA